MNSSPQHKNLLIASVSLIVCLYAVLIGVVLYAPLRHNASAQGASALDRALDNNQYQVTGSPTISGRVTDSKGRPIAGVSVNLDPVTADASQAPAAFITDASGNYSIDVNKPGLFKVHFSAGQTGSGNWAAQWYGSQNSEAEATSVPVGAKGVDAVLSATGVLAGHVAFPSQDAPFPVEVMAYRADSPEVAANGGTDLVSPQPADFSFTSLPEGDYKLLIVPGAAYNQSGPGVYGPFWYGGDDWNGAATVSVKAGKTTDVNLSFPTARTGTVFGTVLFDRDAYSSVSLSLVDSNDPNSAVAQDGHVALLPDLKSFGYFEFDNVPDGVYKLKCTFPDGGVAWYQQGALIGSLDYAQATTINVDTGRPAAGKIAFNAFALPAQVSGQLTSTGGQGLAVRPVYGERVTADGAEFESAFLAYTDDSGSYSGRITPGTYRFCAVDWKTLKEYCSEPVSVGWNAQADGVAVSVPDGALAQP